jgi:hypothetical protein
VCMTAVAGGQGGGVGFVASFSVAAACQAGTQPSWSTAQHTCGAASHTRQVSSNISCCGIKRLQAGVHDGSGCSAILCGGSRPGRLLTFWSAFCMKHHIFIALTCSVCKACTLCSLYGLCAGDLSTNCWWVAESMQHPTAHSLDLLRQ